jgi:hypothetical protein
LCFISLKSVSMMGHSFFQLCWPTNDLIFLFETIIHIDTDFYLLTMLISKDLSLISLWWTNFLIWNLHPFWARDSYFSFKHLIMTWYFYHLTLLFSIWHLNGFWCQFVNHKWTSGQFLARPWCRFSFESWLV